LLSDSAFFVKTDSSTNILQEQLKLTASSGFQQLLVPTLNDRICYLGIFFLTSLVVSYEDTTQLPESLLFWKTYKHMYS